MPKDSLVELDRAHWVHPVASLRGHEKAGLRVLSRAKGAWITDLHGRQIVDGFSGLWCVNAGYGQQSLIDAATRQLEELPYATGYFGLGSEPAVRLASKLASRAPGDLSHVFFTLGGSDAVDSTIRYIQLYQHAKGTPARDQYISMEYGYHGSSSAGAGLTALPAFHNGFQVPHHWQHKIPSHYIYRNPVGTDPEAIIAASLTHLRDKVEELGPERVAAFYVEPIQGSGGVLVPPPGWMKALCDACHEMGILFIADEVITGFGRTGPLFACEEEGIEPDFITTAKGLTSGYIPMGAVFMSDKIYQTIADFLSMDTVGHGFTYSGHPVSAAVGLAALELYEGGLLQNGQKIGLRLMNALKSLSDHPLVGDVRGRGMLAAIELVTNKRAKTPLPASTDPGQRLFNRAWDAGLIIRAFGNGVLGFAPPLCCTEDDIDQIVHRTRVTLDQTLEDPDIRMAIKE